VKDDPAVQVFLLSVGNQIEVRYLNWENTGGNKMKKVIAFALALTVGALGIPLLAHGKPPVTSQDEKKPELVTVRGTVNADGDKRSLVDDKDGKSWEVDNPEMLKEHVGHHVELSCQMNADRGQIHIIKVTMLTTR
jgi:hypothetical protein